MRLLLSGFLIFGCAFSEDVEPVQPLPSFTDEPFDARPGRGQAMVVASVTSSETRSDSFGTNGPSALHDPSYDDDLHQRLLGFQVPWLFEVHGDRVKFFLVEDADQDGRNNFRPLEEGGVCCEFLVTGASVDDQLRARWHARVENDGKGWVTAEHLELPSYLHPAVWEELDSESPVAVDFFGTRLQVEPLEDGLWRGRVGGVLRAEDLDRVPDPLCRSSFRCEGEVGQSDRARLRGLGVEPDVDLDGDGQNDAFSVSYDLQLRAATIRGITDPSAPVEDDD